MQAEFEAQLLSWLSEEIDGMRKINGSCVFSIKLLMLRLALSMRSNETSITESTEISLQSYDRSNIFRNLAQLNKKGFVSFIGPNDTFLNLNEVQSLYSKFVSGKEIGEVLISGKGLEYLKVINREQEKLAIE